MLLLLLGAAPVWAQEAPPTGAPTIRLGPLGLTPRISITDIGVDTNIKSQSENPQRDFTAVINPAVDLQLTMRRVELSATTELGYRYFGSVIGERALDVTQDARLTIGMNRVAPFIDGSYASETRRPNLEIDARVHRTQQRVGIGTEVRIGPQTTLEVGVERGLLLFDDVEFAGANLRSELNRESSLARALFRMALTPLTTFVVTGEAQRDRFEFSPVRDANMVSVLPGFELDPAALIEGSAFVGYRSFKAVHPSLPDFGGVIADVAVAYTLLGRTRFAVTGERSVEYSFEPREPYYLLSGGGLVVTQALGGRWDALGRFERSSLAYRQIADLLPGPSGQRVDRVETYGFGFGHRLGEAIRVGLEVNHVQRRSVVRGRNFEGWRVGGSFVYGAANGS